MTEDINIDKTVCSILTKIEKDLFLEAFNAYAGKRYSEFWRDIEFLNDFLNLKKVKCPIDK